MFQILYKKVKSGINWAYMTPIIVHLVYRFAYYLGNPFLGVELKPILGSQAKGLKIAKTAKMGSF